MLIDHDKAVYDHEAFNSAYDLFLSRELHRARIVRIPTSPAVVQGFLDQRLDVAAGVKQQLEKDAAKAGGLRLLDQRFMVIRQAMGVPKAKGDEAAVYLAKFVEDMNASGFVAAALAQHKIAGAAVAKDNDYEGLSASGPVSFLSEAAGGGRRPAAGLAADL